MAQPPTNGSPVERLRELQRYFNPLESRALHFGKTDAAFGAIQDGMDAVGNTDLYTVAKVAGKLVELHWKEASHALIDGNSEVAKRLIAKPMVNVLEGTLKESFSAYAVAIPNLPFTTLIRLGYFHIKQIANNQTPWDRALKDLGKDLMCQAGGGAAGGALGVLLGAPFGPAGSFAVGILGKIAGNAVGDALGGQWKGRELRALLAKEACLRKEVDGWFEEATAKLSNYLHDTLEASARRYRSSIVAAPPLELIGPIAAKGLWAVGALVASVRARILEQRGRLAALRVLSVDEMPWTVRWFQREQAKSWAAEQATALQRALRELDEALGQLPDVALAAYDPLASLERLLMARVPLDVAPRSDEIHWLAVRLQEYAAWYRGELRAWRSREDDRFQDACRAREKLVESARADFLHQLQEKREQITTLDQDIQRECRELGLKTAA